MTTLAYVMKGNTIYPASNFPLVAHRYQTLVGDHPFTFSDGPSMELETLLGRASHFFNNSENPGNPYVPSAGDDNSGLYVDQAQVGMPWFYGCA